MRRQAVALGVALTLAASVLAACSGGGVDAEPGFSATSSTTGTATSVPTSTIDPKALPAVQAYEASVVATRAAQRAPFGLDDPIRGDADFTKTTFDPFRTQTRGYIAELADQGGEYRGAPPRVNVVVESVDLNADPWPTVILSDCQSGSTSWRLYNAKTGAAQPRATPKVSPPYRITVTVIFYKKHWGVQKLTTDSSRTCTP